MKIWGQMGLQGYHMTTNIFKIDVGKSSGKT